MTATATIRPETVDQLTAALGFTRPTFEVETQRRRAHVDTRRRTFAAHEHDEAVAYAFDEWRRADPARVVVVASHPSHPGSYADRSITLGRGGVPFDGGWRVWRDGRYVGPLT